MREITLDDFSNASQVTVLVNDKVLKAKFKKLDHKITFQFNEISLEKNDKITIKIG